MKTLKFLGIALLACGLMFTSCKKDNPQPDNNDNTTDNPGGGGGTTPTNGATIAFDGDNTTWNANSIVAVDHSDQNYLYMQIYKTANAEEGVYVSGYLESEVGSYTYANTYDLMYYTDPNFNYTDQTGELGQLLGADDLSA